MIMESSLNENNNWLHVADVGGQRHVMCFKQRHRRPPSPVVQPHARNEGFCDLTEKKKKKTEKMLLLPCRLDELMNTNLFFTQ